MCLHSLPVDTRNPLQVQNTLLPLTVVVYSPLPPSDSACYRHSLFSSGLNFFLSSMRLTYSLNAASSFFFPPAAIRRRRRTGIYTPIALRHACRAPARRPAGRSLSRIFDITT